MRNTNTERHYWTGKTKKKGGKINFFLKTINIFSGKHVFVTVFHRIRKRRRNASTCFLKVLKGAKENPFLRFFPLHKRSKSLGEHNLLIQHPKHTSVCSYMNNLVTWNAVLHKITLNTSHWIYFSLKSTRLEEILFCFKIRKDVGWISLIFQYLKRALTLKLFNGENFWIFCKLGCNLTGNSVLRLRCFYLGNVHKGFPRENWI